MGEAKSQQAWAHTSSVLAMLANLHRDPKKTRTYKPDDFNPHVRKHSVTIQKVGIGLLKQVFIDSRKEGL
ncbi:MAG: hypothetical protein RIS70_951 [Planctomycetota bacterium]|jgi:hypothetical protein